HRHGLSAAAGVDLLPSSQQLHNDICAVALEEQLREEVQVGHERSLQDDRDVRSVEQLDRIAALLTTVLRVFHREIDTETLGNRKKQHKASEPRQQCINRQP